MSFWRRQRRSEVLRRDVLQQAHGLRVPCLLSLIFIFDERQQWMPAFMTFNCCPELQK